MLVETGQVRNVKASLGEWFCDTGVIEYLLTSLFCWPVS